MFLFEVAPEHAMLLLRAMRAACLADGAVTIEERALLESARAALGLECSVDDLESIDAPALAMMNLAPAEREHVIQAMILMTVIDGAASESEARLVDDCARALGVDDPRVHNIAQLAKGRIDLMKWDLTRKGYARDAFFSTAREEGVVGLYRTFGPIIGLGRDAELVRHYNDLGKLPKGSLGNAYWDFIVRNDLGFPGEHHALGERGVWHDMLHVVGEYPITPIGEAEVVAFMSGFRREDPFFWLFTVALQFQVGLRISPFAPAAAHQIDPARFVRHIARGARMKRDISADWNFRADYHRPIDEVRVELGVTPLD